MKHIEYLKGLRLNGSMACDPGLRYATRYQSLREAWEKCQRPDWMLWLLRAAGVRDDKRCRLYACWCIRHTPIGDGRTLWDMLADERSRNVVIVAERFVRGRATREQLAAASTAAWTATSDAASAAASDAAMAAASTADSDAVSAAWTAARAAAWTSAWTADSAAQANQLRIMFAAAFNRIEAKMISTSGKE